MFVNKNIRKKKLSLFSLLPVLGLPRVLAGCWHPYLSWLPRVLAGCWHPYLSWLPRVHKGTAGHPYLEIKNRVLPSEEDKTLLVV